MDLHALNAQAIQTPRKKDKKERNKNQAMHFENPHKEEGRSSGARVLAVLCNLEPPPRSSGEGGLKKESVINFILLVSTEILFA